MIITHLTPAEFKTVPWKNGNGSTRELRLEKLESDDSFAWRLSMAPVIADGLFSDFSGYDRKLVLVEGNGMTLRHGNGQIDNLNNCFDIACFDGSWRTEAQLHQGEILDFNVMTRQGVCTSQVEAFAKNAHHRLPVQAEYLLIYALDNELSISLPEFGIMQLAAGHLLEVRQPTDGVWEIVGSAFICVQIKLVGTRPTAAG